MVIAARGGYLEVFVQTDAYMDSLPAVIEDKHERSPAGFGNFCVAKPRQEAIGSQIEFAIGQSN